MYSLKQLPQDFLVKELSSIKPEPQGFYSVFRLTKTNYNTLDAVKLLAQRLRVPLKNIGFAGSKDKKAMTEQLISVRGVSVGRVLSLKLKDISLEFLGYGDSPICLGDLEGNYFEIVVRGLDSFDFKKVDKIINYFDEQRFGKDNISVGRGLVRKDFKKVCELLELGVKGNDFVTAIKKIPKRLLKLYVHAYQSFIWNETVKEIIKNKIKIDQFPLIGFATELGDYNQKIKNIINTILKKENLTLKDFIVRQIPELSLEGGFREVFVKVEGFKVLEKGEDELNPGKKKVKVSFSLEKGSYATLVVKGMF